jgi:hypothetical protein
MFDDALDRTVLTRRIASFEDHEHALAAFDHVPLQLYQLDLEMEQLPLISFVAQGRR